MKLRLAVLGVCVAAGSLLYPGTAGAATVRTSAITCGMTVSTSITLTRDLVCSGTALFVATDTTAPISLTIDLAGHTVSSISARAFNVTMTLENGRVAGGVDDEGANDLYTNLTFDGGGITSVNDASPRIYNSRFIHGASIYSGENSIDIEHNVFSGAGATLGGRSAAIWLTMTYSTVLDNVIAGYDTGIQVFEELGSANIQRNVLFHNGAGIRIGGPHLPATIKNNLAIANRGDGIVIGDGTNSEVTGNTTILNGGDGIRIDPTPVVGTSPSGIIARLSRNASWANGGWGIEAPPASASIAVVDGGRNSAHFNRAGQCRNFPCR